MERIVIFDTSLETLNLGDEIIMESVYKYLREIFEDDMFARVSTHEKLGDISRHIIRTSKLGFVGGTNLLSSNMRNKSNQWNITLKDIKSFNDVILMGTGWQANDSNVNLYTKLVYNKALSKNYIHSVRDSQAEKKLKDIGINNVVNTGCPTLWELDEKHCLKIKKEKSKNVICTFTDYCKDEIQDKKMAEILLRNYERVYCWVQGSEDYKYIKKISDKFIIVNPNLESFDRVLESNYDLDYVGTRLHAGIRAMQRERRAIIISIDNRAREMGRDFNLNIVDRDEIEKVESVIKSSFETKLNLNWDGINIWKNQFKNC